MAFFTCRLFASPLTVAFVKTLKCPKCSGTGRIADPVMLGASARSKRERSGISLRDLARTLNISAAYLSDLELGRRSWPIGLSSRYVTALDQMKGKP